MAEKITDEMMEHLEILSKLKLNVEEKKRAKQDLQKMLDYFEKLKEIDTGELVLSAHWQTEENVFREDVVTNKEDREQMLANAPSREGGWYKVPKTLDGV